MPNQTYHHPPPIRGNGNRNNRGRNVSRQKCVSFGKYSKHLRYSVRVENLYCLCSAAALLNYRCQTAGMQNPRDSGFLGVCSLESVCKWLCQPSDSGTDDHQLADCQFPTNVQIATFLPHCRGYDVGLSSAQSRETQK